MARNKPRKGRASPVPQLPKLPPEVREAVLKLQPEAELLAEALGTIIASGGKDALGICQDTYCRFHALTPAEALSGRHIVQMSALFCRISALSDFLATNVIDLGSAHAERFAAIVEAACTVRLLAGDDLPRFQPLEFLAAVQRIEADLGRGGYGRRRGP